MQLTASPELQAIKDAVRIYADKQISAARLAAWRRLPEGIDASAWQQIADLGWFGLGLPVHAGGSGLGLIEVAALLEECGRALVPPAVIAAIRAALALASVDADCPQLADIGRGANRVALAFEERDARDPQGFCTRLVQDDASLTVCGEKWYVSGAVAAPWHLVAAREDSGVSLLLVDATACRMWPLRSFDEDLQAKVVYERAPVVRRLTQAGAGAAALQRIRRQQTALALAEMAGGMDAVLWRSVDYVKQRSQFGQKLAVFQAVQHQIADMATALTAARHLAWQAITRMAYGTEDGSELPIAAAFVGQWYKRATLMAHHLHGGAGYVVEHPLHYYAERAQGLCVRDTPEAAALEAVAAALLDGE